ncbi:hypothetical protein EUTSA_v10026849mg [Eutrema salsugineum]|uniref:Uncharacterized protein n=1 Tax=Eutrema salsugineum TaxID=72664 RepID=V4MSW6_EUTSA|nr:protein RALF-like 30 [Eutrema salsugineum]ESQ56423.1 hypothetical protein EUTSA_v10026849mg [Eutrema salsugineum]
MKAWVICLMLISIVLMAGPSSSEDGRKFLKPGLLNPCSRPNPPVGCHPPGSEGKPKEEVNEHKPGCSKINRCRSGDHP